MKPASASKVVSPLVTVSAGLTLYIVHEAVVAVFGIHRQRDSRAFAERREVGHRRFDHHALMRAEHVHAASTPNDRLS